MQADSQSQKARFQGDRPLSVAVEAALKTMVINGQLDLAWTSEDVWTFVDAWLADHPEATLAQLVPMVIDHIKDGHYGANRHRNNFTAVQPPVPSWRRRRLPSGSRPTHQNRLVYQQGTDQCRA